ncbi:MAG: C4-dicarboxylic acid transporter DauA [Longimicrobiales bacterium]|nr:C4-dicarboxylic acid transporter DauA [Longimicrobiales bacterium]
MPTPRLRPIRTGGLVNESRFVPACALRTALAGGYGLDDLRADALAGLVVGVVALPLSMALAIASGVPPQYGLYTAIVAGLVIAPLGGSRVQVSGPTAAFVVVLAPIAANFGIAGLLLATAMAGVVLIVLALARMGRLIEFVPYPVTAGFTAGIAVVIATLQVKDLLGLSPATWPDHWVERVGALLGALPTLRLPDLLVGAGTLVVLLFWRRVNRSIPAPLVGLLFGALLAAVLAWAWPGAGAATIDSRFGSVLDGVVRPGIPRLPPLPVAPWSLPGPGGDPLPFNLDTLRALLPAAFTIAILGAIESLLSAVVADGMTRQKHDPDAELFAQGVGNLVGPFFGGIAATGAVARTATNIRAGGRTPLSAVFHALFVLAAVLILAPLLGYLPMASLAALLLVVAWNMSEARHVVRMVRTAPRSDVVVLLTCLGLTVVFDMVVAVTAGVMLAALLFLRRMAEVADVRLVADPHTGECALPRDAVLYELAGPMFFGAAQKAMSALRTVSEGTRTVVLDMRSVPVLDATALVNLESAVERLCDDGVLLVLAGVRPGPLRTLARAGWRERRDKVSVRRSFANGVRDAWDRSEVAPGT